MALRMERMTQIAMTLLLAMCLAGAPVACAPKASEEEIERMCDRLAALRGKAKDGGMKQKCAAEARREGISKRQARCRISAVNTQEYWSRCRTGDAR